MHGRQSMQLRLEVIFLAGDLWSGVVCAASAGDLIFEAVILMNFAIYPL